MKNIRKTPPKLGSWLINRTVDKAIRYSVLGDFEERFDSNVDEKGLFTAWILYWFQLFIILPISILYRISWRIVMIRNYLLIALRNIKKHRGFYFINISGLAVGITCCLLILLYVADELSFDRFYEKSDRIYRAIIERKFADRTMTYSTSPVPLAEEIINNYPEVECVVRIFYGAGTNQVRYKEKVFEEKNMAFADSDFFKVFSIPLIHGNPNTVLKDMNAVVITRNVAIKFFGDENPIGKSLFLNNEEEYIVQGVSEDMPNNSHFRFN